MEPIFENRYFTDKKMIREFARKYSVGPSPLASAILLPFVALHLLFLFTVDTGRPQDWYLLLCCGIIIVLQFFPRIYAASLISGMKKQNDGVLPETVVAFGEENIQMFEGMMHLTIEYRKITKALRLKHSYALFNGKRTAVLIKPDGFTKGSFEEFKTFLREKCPDIKIEE